jgi:hypothetical protein
MDHSEEIIYYVRKKACVNLFGGRMKGIFQIIWFDQLIFLGINFFGILFLEQNKLLYINSLMSIAQKIKMKKI